MKYESVEQAKDYLLAKIGSVPEIAIIMGSGLSALDEILQGAARIHYVSIPHFTLPKVAGHRAQVIHGKAGNRNVVVFEGRVHYYEGHTMDEVTFCTRVIGRLGARTLILTNASGAINPQFSRGQLMLISDHINFMGLNPLRGPNEDRWGTRFVDLTNVWDAQLRAKLKGAAEYCGIHIEEGVYAAMSGPSYETPAEIRMLRMMGADCVGMSTVPEAIVARHMGMRVAGISMLANFAAGLSDKPVNHEEVLETANQLNADIGMLLQRFFENMTNELLTRAIAARGRAIATFSNFKVGAALLTKHGKIYEGCNIENASFGLTVCAERLALLKALSEGEREFSEIVVVTAAERLTPPCGPCRQLLWEFCPDIRVVLHSTRGIEQAYQISELFPHPFDTTHL